MTTRDVLHGNLQVAMNVLLPGVRSDGAASGHPPQSRLISELLDSVLVSDMSTHRIAELTVKVGASGE